MRLLLLVGITRRTGTNLLRDLLALHPEISAASHLSEDCLLAPSQHLIDYERWITGTWSNWAPDDALVEYRSDLYQGFGKAIEGVLLSQAEDPDARFLASKSPVSRNLSLLPQLLPGRPLVVITRDGRSTVESTMRSFQTPFKEATQLWIDGARSLLELRVSPAVEGKDFHVVRFEDLRSDLEGTLRSLVTTLELESDQTFLDRAVSLPVKGSCDEVAESGKVEWTPTQRGSDFRPEQRHAEWTSRRRKQFAKLAGPEQEALGYSLD